LPQPIEVDGPSGGATSLLVAHLVRELTRLTPALTIQCVSANDWPTLFPRQLENAPLAAETCEPELGEPAWLDEARLGDLLVLEDLQHLPARGAETLAQLLDARQK